MKLEDRHISLHTVFVTFLFGDMVWGSLQPLLQTSSLTSLKNCMTVTFLKLNCPAGCVCSAHHSSWPQCETLCVYFLRYQIAESENSVHSFSAFRFKGTLMCPNRLNISPFQWRQDRLQWKTIPGLIPRSSTELDVTLAKDWKRNLSFPLYLGSTQMCGPVFVGELPKQKKIASYLENNNCLHLNKEM